MPFESVFRPRLFAGQGFIVTGGGSGIGRCIAHELAGLGGAVALVGRKMAKLEIVAAEIADAGGSAHCFTGDIREESQARASIGAALKALGRIDGLVNNAGGQFSSPAAAISQKGWETVVRTNLTGGFLMAREVFTQWMRDHGGAIVNIVADMWSGMPGMAHSGAARAGMVNLTETAAVEWAPSGVRVNAVAPGWIASSGFDTYPESVRPMLRNLHRCLPAQRLGTESEISAAVCFLLTPAAAFISGTTLRVDGAAPNAKTNWPMPAHDKSKPWNGFHLASMPKVLQGD